MHPYNVPWQLGQMRQAEIRQEAAKQRLAAQVHAGRPRTSLATMGRRLHSALWTALRSRWEPASRLP